MKTLRGAGRTKVYKDFDRAETVAMAIQARIPDWVVSVQPSPEPCGGFGVRAHRVLLDINENGCGCPVDGRKPLAMIMDAPSPLAGSTGHCQTLWLKENGLIYFPKEDTI